jgi:hypothetical protein
MLRFQLFRAKVYPPAQPSLFAPLDTAQALRSAIESKPSAELRRGFDWHIGNVEPIDDHSVYFALGRTTRSHVELFDEDSGNFVVQEFEASPYTHGVLDYENQVCAIAAKARLAPTVTGIARQFEKLLAQSETAQRTSVRFDIAVINDPEGFIEQLSSAFQISRFAVEFSRPNPWDVDADFQKPMEDLLRETRGQKGKTTLKGENLDAARLEELTRSAAASGNDAEADIRRTPRARRQRRRLRGNPVTVSQEDCSTAEERRSLVRQVREIYERVRARVESK